MPTQRSFLAICFVAILAAALSFKAASAQVRVYIVTDLEGASGVHKFAQTREPGNLLIEKALTAQVLRRVPAIECQVPFRPTERAFLSCFPPAAAGEIVSRSWVMIFASDFASGPLQNPPRIAENVVGNPGPSLSSSPGDLAHAHRRMS